jgi:transposase
MKRLQAFKYELRPNSEQECAMRRFAGSCRFVFNKALAMQKVHTTPVRLVLAAAKCRKTIGSLKRNLCVSIVATKITPM